MILYTMIKIPKVFCTFSSFKLELSGKSYAWKRERTVILKIIKIFLKITQKLHFMYAITRTHTNRLVTSLMHAKISCTTTVFVSYCLDIEWFK